MRKIITQDEAFELANDPDFIIAIMEAEDGAPALQRSKFKTIGDRKRLIMRLAEKGFIITKYTGKIYDESV